MNSKMFAKPQSNRRDFIGGSDAKIIMGEDETALHRLWREKRGAARQSRWESRDNQDENAPLPG